MKFQNYAFEFIFAGSFVVWQAYGIEGAGNVFRLIAWMLAILMLVSAPWAAEALRKQKTKTPAVWRAYINLRSVAVVLAAAWLGMTWLAAAWITGYVVLKVITTEVKS